MNNICIVETETGFKQFFRDIQCDKCGIIWKADVNTCNDSALLTCFKCQPNRTYIDNNERRSNTYDAWCKLCGEYVGEGEGYIFLATNGKKKWDTIHKYHLDEDDS